MWQFDRLSVRQWVGGLLVIRRRNIKRRGRKKEPICLLKNTGQRSIMRKQSRSMLAHLHAGSPTVSKNRQVPPFMQKSPAIGHGCSCLGQAAVAATKSKGKNTIIYLRNKPGKKYCFYVSESRAAGNFYRQIAQIFASQSAVVPEKHSTIRKWKHKWNAV